MAIDYGFKTKYPTPFEHVILSQQFTPEYLDGLFELAQDIERSPQKYSEALRGWLVALYFTEPSTRTWTSFDTAVKRMGGQTTGSENASQFSSAVKGETLEDTMRILSGYGVNAIVLRHHEDDSSKRAVEHASCPVINAGSGKSQHPTQALLDLYTIWRQRRRLYRLEVAVAGDLARGRTVDSLVYLLSAYESVHINFISPYNCRVKRELLRHLKECNISYAEHEELTEHMLARCDVLYMTRVQKERFGETERYEDAVGKIVLTQKLADAMPEDAIIMHPLPRNSELPIAIDKNPRARYFQQAANGLWVRMALLYALKHQSLVMV